MVKNQPKVKASVRSVVARKKTFIPELELPQRDNYIILGIGVAVIILGYIVMSMGDAVSPLSITIAPIILFIGYCVIVPLGIVFRKKSTVGEKSE
jgi:hypothetical protein